MILRQSNKMLVTLSRRLLICSYSICLYVFLIALSPSTTSAQSQIAEISTNPYFSPRTSDQIMQSDEKSLFGQNQQDKIVISKKLAQKEDYSRQKRQILVENNQAHYQQDSYATSDQDQQGSGNAEEASLRNHHEMPQALESPYQASSEQQQQQQRGKRTLYACEGKQLEIECQLGEFIQLIRANYGRFSIQICNEHGQLDWKVNCMSPASYQIIASSCQSKQSCQLLASNEIFGDACPGTQKYLEVHYQCVQGANQTTLEQQVTTMAQAAVNRVQPQKAPKPQNNVIPQQDQASETTASSVAGAFLVRPQPRWPQQPGGQTAPSPQLPPWMLDTVLSSTSSPLSSAVGDHRRPSAASGAQHHQCPELVARNIKWPATDAGLVVQMPCPQSLAQPSSPVDLFAASLVCLPGGQWAKHVQAARCQSFWLRNLTQRHEAGDSLLSVLGELVQRTRPAAQSLNGGQWPPLWAGAQQQEASSRTMLFGDDLVQIARIVRRLAGDELAELLARIADDKQRVSFARDAIQLLAELVSNLAHPQHHQEAWLDLELAPVQTRERQRVAGQLVASLEQASVLLAGALNQQQQQQHSGELQNQDDFLKVTENVYLTIRSVNVPVGQATEFNSTELSFPSAASTLGTRWMGSEQRFVLSLQATQDPDSSGPAALDGAQQMAQLKVVFVMLRSLGAQMEPANQIQEQQQQQQVINGKHSFQLVNSDLVSLALVADARRSKVKIDLFAPIELTFRQQQQQQQHQADEPARWTSAPELQQRQSSVQRCAFWDSSISDWLGDGCKLIASNRTHSTCACNHLTTFALLSSATQATAANGDWPVQQAEQDKTRQLHYNSFQARVPLESVENELQLGAGSATKTLYLAKLLDGNLFATTATSARHEQAAGWPVVHIVCLLAALLLALLLAAAAYCRAHARRLLGSMPSEPPPSLLVSSNYNGQQQAGGLLHSLGGPQRGVTDENGTQANGSPPSSYTTTSDYSAALAASRQKLRNELVTSTSSCADSSTGNSLAYGAPQGSDGVQQALKLAAASLYGQIGGTQASIKLAAGPQDRSSKGELQLPARLLVQLLALQLLLVLMLESQSLLQRQPLMTATIESGLPLPPPQQQQQLDALGLPTWCLVGLFYYLIASFLCWLLVSLLRLNGHLMLEQRDAQMRRNLGGSHARPTNANCLYGSGRATNNLYDSTLGAAQRQHLSVPEALQELSSMANHYGSASAKECHNHSMAQGKQASALLKFCFCSTRLGFILEHGGPLALSALLVYLSLDKGQSINQLAYSSSLGAQLALWPLALDCAWTLPLALLLYFSPAICLLLGASSLMALRRLLCGQRNALRPREADSAHQQRFNAKHLPGRLPSPPLNPYGNSSSAAKLECAERGTSPLHWLPMVSGAGQQHHQQQQRQPPAVTVCNGEQLEHSAKWKRAKFVCLHLLAMLALHSICWLAFFAHCRQAVAAPSAPSAHLIWVFASSDLLCVLLLCWTQRRLLRRACHLVGLAGSLAGCCSSGAADVQSRAATDASPYFMDHQQQQQQQNHRTTKPMKVSPVDNKQSTSGSLFTISNGRSQQRAFYETSALHQQQQHHHHLYQQLAVSQQHIYDSANGGGGGAADWHAYQAQQQQQHALTLNRSLIQAGLQFGAAQPTHLASFGQDSRQAAHLATMARVQPNYQDQQQQLNGVRRKQPGEAEGPLVELTTSSSSSASSSAASSASQQQQQQALPSTTFGPQHQQQQQQQRNGSTQLMATNGQLADSMATEHRQFSLPQQQPIDLHAALRASFVATSGGALLHQQQQQFAEQAEQCAMDNFRSHSRTTVTMNRQQQPHRPLPMMIDGFHKQQQRAASQEEEVCSMANNIYDVANYCVS